MNSKLKLILVLTILSVALLQAQTKKVVVTTELKGEADLENVVVDEIRLEVLNDSTDNHIKWVQEGNWPSADSGMQNVFMVRSPMHDRKAARIVIKESGLFKKNKIIIDFDPISRRIVKVIDNDKEIDPIKFHKYQDYLEDATEFAELEALHPRMEELEFKIQSSGLADSEKLADLDAILIDLEALKSDRALFKKEHYSSIKKIIELDELEDSFQKILEEAGITPPQKLESISIKNGKFFLNGEEVKGEPGEKCVEAYLGLTDPNLEGLEIKGEAINIEITFD